ncbi:MAG: hypothetical protein IJ634_02960 [Bacteroidales bacterium]|nr:hypothetical protein [Bacteroidales bacterium]
MKRTVIIILLMLTVPLGVAAQGQLYKQYASRPGLTVAQVDGFRLCDSVSVDVVMLQADNEEAWQRLCREFDIRGEETVVSWLGDPKKPAQRVKWSGKGVYRVVASHKRRTIAFYRLDNEQQYDALVDYQMGKMKNEK